MGLRSASSPSPPPFWASPTTATPKFPLIPGLPRPSPAMWDSILSAVRTRDDKYYITSPNCKFVTEPLVGRVVVALRADYRYGPTDPIQWPQITAAKWEYLSVIRRGMPSNDPRAVMWADPPERDFEVIQGCQFTSLGLFKKSSIHSLLAQARDPVVRRRWERGGSRAPGARAHVCPLHGRGPSRPAVEACAGTRVPA